MMARPQVVSRRHTSPAADIFSFGVVMWQMFTGQDPWCVAPDGSFTRNPLFPKFKPDDPPSWDFTYLMAR